jgi:opacity protein-like surface antigen
MTSRLLMLIVVVLLTICVDVCRASAEWTLAAFVGGARTQDSTIGLSQASQSTDVTLSLVRYRSESLNAPIYYGYRIGVFASSGWIGIEGEFIHLKVIADTARPVMREGVIRGVTVSDVRPLATVLERFSITHGVNLLLVNAVARRAIQGSNDGPPRWFFTGRAGAGASVPHPESTIAGVNLERYEWGSFSFQAAGGMELRLTNRLYLSGEYKFTHTVQHVSVAAGGSVRTPLTTQHLLAGVVAHIGRDAN